MTRSFKYISVKTKIINAIIKEGINKNESNNFKVPSSKFTL